MTKILLSSFIIFVAATIANAQLKRTVRLPKTWTKEFSVGLHYDNAMGGSWTDVSISYDTCTYKILNQTEGSALRKYLMTEEDRLHILKELQTLGASKLKSGDPVLSMHDGWAESITIGYTSIHGGAGIVMSSESRKAFVSIYQFLEDFAVEKTK